MSVISHIRHSLKLHPTRFMLFVLGVMVVVRWAASYFEWGWHIAAGLAIGLFAINSLYAYLMDDETLKRIILFSIVAGFTELIADWWLVDVTQTLVYAPNEPFIWRSPFYMPFAWAMILMNIGYLSYLLHAKENWVLLIITSALIGGTVIPAFEYFAYGAEWWYYQGCEMIWHVPYYIILGEALICAFLGFTITYLETHKHWVVVALGVAQGLWIWGAYYLSYNLICH